jgi:FdhD protein
VKSRVGLPFGNPTFPEIHWVDVKPSTQATELPTHSLVQDFDSTPNPAADIARELPSLPAPLGLSGDLGWPACREYPVERQRGDERYALSDQVIEEAPVAIVYNGQPHVVMLATPLDLEDFAYGFSLTEGIVESPSEIFSARVFYRSEGIELRIRISEERFAELPGKERNLAGRTGCGLCGAAELRQAVRHPPPVRSSVRVGVEELRLALREIHARQPLNQLTGAIHAAAWAVPGLGILQVREDVGRHNALDKLIGVLARKRVDRSVGFVVVTSRASYEMVQKCASASIGFMAAISAPTGLAIRLAQETGLTLVGFARGDSHVVYANPGRLPADRTAARAAAQ